MKCSIPLFSFNDSCSFLHVYMENIVHFMLNSSNLFQAIGLITVFHTILTAVTGRQSCQKLQLQCLYVDSDGK